MEFMPDTVDAIVTHNGCFDGHTSHYLLNLRWPNATWFPGIYNDQPTLDAIVEMGTADRVLVIADFSFPLDDMQRIADRWGTVVVLDHHKSAVEHLDGKLPGNVIYEFDLDRSGAGLVADWLGCRSTLVDYIEDRDLWRHALPDSKAINAYIAAQPLTLHTWSNLDSLLSSTKSFPTVVGYGSAVLARDEVIVNELVDNAITLTIGGYDVPATAAPYALGSETAGRLAELHPDAPFAAYFRVVPGRVEYGLRSRDTSGDGGFDVSAVAELYGGGGHRNASGFRIESDTPVVQP